MCMYPDQTCKKKETTEPKSQTVLVENPDILQKSKSSKMMTSSKLKTTSKSRCPQIEDNFKDEDNIKNGVDIKT